MKRLLRRAARADRDRDGRANVRDRDVDGDGTANRRDRNVDGDRSPNGRDRDVDGDRFPNRIDRNIDGDRRSNSRDGDMDGDRIRNRRDSDADGDGRRNDSDPDPTTGCGVAGAMPPPPTRGTTPPAAGFAPAPRTQLARLPRAFFGVVAEDAFVRTGRDRDAVLAAVAATGVGTVRQRFDWSAIERAPGVYDFSDFDSYLAATARHGLDVLPILFHPPRFRLPGGDLLDGVSGDLDLPGHILRPPASNQEFAEFAKRLVRRYGSGGSLWSEHPELPARPITSWQIWNEPSLPVFWQGQPDARAYTAMLRVVGSAIKTVDPAAQIVAAGLPDSRSGVPLEQFLADMYAAGARNAFDKLALHPYATSATGMVAIVERARAIMARHGDADAQIWLTEFGWAAGFDGSHRFAVDEAAQASLVQSALRTIAAHADRLRLRGAIYYDWRDLPVYEGGRDFWGLHTGLHWADGSPKQAAAAFARAVQLLTLP